MFLCVFIDDPGSLATMTCNLLLKCLPVECLPVPSLTNPLPFFIEQFKMEVHSEPDCSEEDNEEVEENEEVKPPTVNSEDSLSSTPLSLLESLHLKEESPLEASSIQKKEEHKPILSPQSWFIDMSAINNGGVEKEGEDLSIQKSKSSLLTLADLSAYDEFFPELSYGDNDKCLSLTRSVSLPVVSLYDKGGGGEGGENIRTSISAASFDGNSRSVECLVTPYLTHPTLVLSSYTHTESLIFPDLPPSVTTEQQYKKSPSVDRYMYM